MPLATRPRSGPGTRIAGLLIPGLLLACGAAVDPSGSPSSLPASSAPSLSLVKKITVTSEGEGGSARPEIVATADRVFVVYLGHIGDANGRTFDVRVYDPDLATQISSKTIVPPSAAYGMATDIRIAADGQFAFAFYETATPAATYLHGAKYALTDSFERVASTGAPITSGKAVFEMQEGDEVLNDPAPLVGPRSVFVVTRLMASIGRSGKTVYRVREFSKTDLTSLSQFDLDLSGVADGRGRVASLLYWNDTILMALATTVSDQGLNDQNLRSDDGALCDIILVKMRPDWVLDSATGVRTISSEPDDRENYVTGLRADGRYFYLAYKQAVAAPPTGEQRAIVKVFDLDFNLLIKEQVKRVSWGGAEAGEIRPSLEISGNRVFSGQSAGRGLGRGDAEIYLYELR